MNKANYLAVPMTAMLAFGVLVLSGSGIEAVPSGSSVRVYYGEAVKLGDGVARTYIEMHNGTPTEIGVALTEGALNGLPDHNTHGVNRVHMENHPPMFSYILALPPEAAATPFNMVELDWNPAGHEPPGIYDEPHFDFHFYTITNEERLAMTPDDPGFAEKAARYPAPEYVPAGYIAPAPVAVPQMGVHWIDPTSPELAGSRFTKTFIYGSYDGRLIFAEPMITRAFLLSKPDFSAAIAQPKDVQEPGYFPTRYGIRYDAAIREYRISLQGLEPRDW